jgi:hypothetical protein
LVFDLKRLPAKSIETDLFDCDLIPAWTFPSGDFLCPIVLDIVPRLKRLLWLIAGLLGNCSCVALPPA